MRGCRPARGRPPPARVASRRPSGSATRRCRRRWLAACRLRRRTRSRVQLPSRPRPTTAAWPRWPRRRSCRTAATREIRARCSLGRSRAGRRRWPRSRPPVPAADPRNARSPLRSAPAPPGSRRCRCARSRRCLPGSGCASGRCCRRRRPTRRSVCRCATPSPRTRPWPVARRRTTPPLRRRDRFRAPSASRCPTRTAGTRAPARECAAACSRGHARPRMPPARALPPARGMRRIRGRARTRKSLRNRAAAGSGIRPQM